MDGNGCSNASTDAFEIIVVADPIIDAQPIAAQELCQAATPTDLSVTVSGGTASAKNYQWFINTTNTTVGGNLIAGSKLKSSSSDSPSWNGTNISGFSGLAGGNRTQFGDFLHLGSFGFFWTSTIAAGNGFYFGLSNGDNTFENDLEQYQQSANSVRCVRD